MPIERRRKLSAAGRAKRGFRRVSKGQDGLSADLQQLLEQMQQGMAGRQPGESGQSGESAPDGMGNFGRAGEAMDDAGRALGQGESGRAFGRQGDALQALRDGLEGMIQQMFSQQPGQGQGDQVGQGPNRQPIDPLGRPQRTQGPDFNRDVEIPDEIDVERARRILNAIRERLGEREQPAVLHDELGHRVVAGIELFESHFLAGLVSHDP